MVCLDRQHRILEWNRAAEALYGCSRKDAIGQDFVERYLAAPARPKLARDIDRVFSGETVSDYEGPVITVEGEEHTLLWSLTGLPETEGQPAGVLVVGQKLNQTGSADFELRASEERHRLVMEAATEGLWDWDCLTDRVHYSSFWKNILGRTEVTATVSTWKSYLHPDDLDRVMSSLQEHLEGKSSHWKEEHRLRAADGSWRWVLGRGRVVARTADGAPLRMVGTMADISDRKRAEEALRDSERILNQVGQMARIGGWEHDLITGKAKWTRALYDLIKLEPGSEPPGTEEHLGYYPPKDRLILEEAYQRSVKDQVSFDLELQCRTTEGELRWFRAYGEPVCRDGICVKMRGTFQDITDRKLAELALRESEEKYRSLVDGADTGICLISPDMEILSLNRKMKEWFPDAEASHDRHCHAVFNHPPLDKPCGYCPVVKTFQSGLVHDAVTDTPTIDGIRHYRVVASPVRGPNDEVVSVIETVEDVTDKIIFERELQKQAKLESIGVLAGGIAHDFNNILAAITGNVSLARLDCDRDSPMAEALKDAAAAADRAAGLTQQLLTFSKGGSPVKQVTSLTAIIVESTRFGLHGSNVKCELDMAPDLTLVDIDPGQISQVMNNLIINADQAMPNGGTIKLSARDVCLPRDDATVPLAGGEYVQVKVIDEGGGIPEKYLSRVFDPFFTTKEKGSGLGLASCYSIIRNHDGLISVTSQQGIGSEFTVYLPATRKTELSRATPESAVPKGDGRILVMDDEKMVRDLVSRVLTKQGYKVEMVCDGLEAVEIYRTALESAKPFDAVILDLTVPGGMGGYDALQQLLAIDPDVVAIVSSGYSHDPVMAHARDHRFAACVSKPFNTVTLARTVYDLVNRKSESNIDAV
jgi:PAS domain S-box-containing protein